MAVKSEPEVVAVRAAEGLRDLRPLDDGLADEHAAEGEWCRCWRWMMAVPVPVRVTKAGDELVPEVTERRPWRVPGCEGAKVMITVQVLLPGRVAGQLVV